ncbi:MAG: hypothetical protein L6Q97_11365 [Thermoanaerobaculia bacterium]|nr:hypothetical protein [Thermoanaerobaculia bacterium]
MPETLLSCIDLDTLTYDDTEYITPDLASVFSDKVYRCNLVVPGGKRIKVPAIIAILLEHKSFAPEYPHFQLRLGFLAYGLLTMKHSHDRMFLEGQMKLIFERGEEFLKTEEGRIFVETLFVYYVRISGLRSPVIKNKIMENIAESVQPEFLSTYDHIKIEGKIEGKIEPALEVAEKLILKFPALPDDQVAEISGAPVEEVKKIRERLSLQ